MSENINVDVDPAEKFGMRLAHVGINAATPEEAAEIAGFFQTFFNLPAEDTPPSYFSGTLVETMKGCGRGDKGHIGFWVNDMDGAEAYFKTRGLTINEESRVFYPDGSPKLVYFNEQIAGFAIHICQQ